MRPFLIRLCGSVLFAFFGGAFGVITGAALGWVLQKLLGPPATLPRAALYGAVAGALAIAGHVSKRRDRSALGIGALFVVTAAALALGVAWSSPTLPGPELESIVLGGGMGLALFFLTLIPPRSERH